MASTCLQNIFVGSESGLLKGIHVEKNSWNNLNSVEKLDKNNEICCMCWGSKEESQVCLGLKSRLVQVYDVDKGQWHDSHHFPGGDGKFCGLAKYDDCFVTAVESGLVKVWRDTDEQQAEINAGGNLHCMSQSRYNPHIIGTGGKENELKLWDLNKPSEPVFRAKNVRNDWLNLRVPVWVLGVQFMVGDPRVITCTGKHQVRVYDPSTSQRRPVQEMEFDEYPLTAISLRPDRQQVIVGNTHGKMALLDLRKGRMVQCYKGFAGGIRDLQCHPTMPLVASCGLDRYLRVHHIDSTDMLHKMYLKSRLNCLLFATKWSPEDDVNHADLSVEKSPKISRKSDDESNNDNEDDEVWSTMKPVKTKTVSKSNVESRMITRTSDNKKRTLPPHREIKRKKQFL